MVPENPELAIYFVLDADKANLALARIAVQKAGKYPPGFLVVPYI